MKIKPRDPDHGYPGLIVICNLSVKDGVKTFVWDRPGLYSTVIEGATAESRMLAIGAGGDADKKTQNGGGGGEYRNRVNLPEWGPVLKNGVKVSVFIPDGGSEKDATVTDSDGNVYIRACSGRNATVFRPGEGGSHGGWP